MAGMDLLLDSVECEASSNMVNVNVIPMSISPLAIASPNALNLEGGCVASTGDVLQEAALSFGMVIAEEEHLASSKGVAGSSTSERADNNACSHFEVSAVTGNIGKYVKSCQLLGTENGFCNPMKDSSDSERDKNLAEIRATGKVQVCAICHEKIKTEETAEIKGCEHSYCVTCILRWATYKAEPWCPQCRLPFSFLYVYRALDGSLSDYLFEESVCLLLRAFWFKPLVVQEPEEQDDYQDDYDAYEEPYYTSNVRLGNRRWGDSGYVRAGRREARPIGVRCQVGESGSSSSRQAKGKELAQEAVGRRARRAQKREQFDKVSGKK